MPFLPETADADLLDFARSLMARAGFVLHRGLGLVGRPVQVWAPGEYTDADGNVITAGVVELEDGNRFILRGEDSGSILEVTQGEVEVYDQLVADLRTVITGAVVAMAQRAPDPQRMPVVLALVNAAVATQLRALRSGGS
jgi:hypothetical protein